MLAGMAFIDRVPAPLKNLAERLRPLSRAFTLWSGAGGMRMSAAMSFYGILSLAPLLLAIVAMLGWWVDRELLEKGLLSQLGSIMGEQGANVIEEALKSAKEPAEGIAASIIGFIVLLFGATGVFGELQNAFELVWSQGRGTPPKQNWRHTASLRLRGLGPLLMRISPANSAAPTTKPSTSLSTRAASSSGNQWPAKPENMESTVDTTSDTSSRKPNTRM